MGGSVSACRTVSFLRERAIRRAMFAVRGSDYALGRRRLVAVVDAPARMLRLRRARETGGGGAGSSWGRGRGRGSAGRVAWFEMMGPIKTPCWVATRGEMPARPLQRGENIRHTRSGEGERPASVWRRAHAGLGGGGAGGGSGVCKMPRPRSPAAPSIGVEIGSFGFDGDWSARARTRRRTLGGASGRGVVAARGRPAWAGQRGDRRGSWTRALNFCGLIL